VSRDSELGQNLSGEGSKISTQGKSTVSPPWD